MTIDRNKLFEQIKYKPHPRQVEFHQSKSRFKVPVCGRRFGKSTMAGRDLEPELLDAGKMFWITGPTYDLGEKEFRVIWNDLIIGQRLGREKSVKKRYNKKQGDMFIEFPWQTRLEVRSADHPENLVGEALHGVIMSEAAKHRPDTFERYIRPALADYRGWASFPTTPEGQNWLYDLWLLGHNPEFADYEAWRFPSWENPYLYPGGRDDPEILLMERTMDDTWFQQEIAADFTAFVGKIYGEFQVDTHVRKHVYNPAWPNYMAFDWGFVSPLAAIEFQISPNDTIWVWREHYKAYETVESHIALLKSRPQPNGYKIDLAFGDHADPEACAMVTQHLVSCVSNPDAKSNWRDGINLVKEFLKMRPVGILDEYGTPLEEPKLFVDHNCPNAIREFNNYKAMAGNTGRNPKSPREAAQAIDDHILDALRYGLMHIYRLGALHSLRETMDIAAMARNVGDAGFITSGVSF